MSENIFAQFNAMFDVEGLKKDIEEAGASDFEKVPVGDYEVKVEKLELGATGANSKVPGQPRVSVWFKIVTGKYRGQRLFMNQNINKAFGIKLMNDFLESLESGIPVEFNDFEQYNDLLQSIFREIDGRAEYQLSYAQNDKGFDTFIIVQRFTN